MTFPVLLLMLMAAGHTEDQNNVHNVTVLM